MLAYVCLDRHCFRNLPGYRSICMLKSFQCFDLYDRYESRITFFNSKNELIMIKNQNIDGLIFGDF